MHTHIRTASLKFIFHPLIASHMRFITALFSLLKISQLHHRSQTPSSHNSTTKEPLLHNNIPAAAMGYNLERNDGHNSGTL